MNDNVTPINRGSAPVTPIRPTEGDPDWLAAANSLDRDFAEEPGAPTVTDPSIPSRYDPVADEMVGERVAGLDESYEIVKSEPGKISEAPRSMKEVLGDHQTTKEVYMAETTERPKARTLSKVEREAQDAEARRLAQQIERERVADERELAADRKRYTEIDPQRLAAFIVALVIAIIIFATSALFSFPAVAATAELMLPVWGFLVWVVPGFVEAFVIYFGIETVIWQARAANTRKYTPGQQLAAQKMSDSALTWMLVFTGVAVISNAAHTFMGYETLGELGAWQAWLGIALAALAPLSVVLITKRVSRLVFIYAIKE